MDWSHKVFGWSWKITLLLLPWQIRWFSTADLAGWPWEQGFLRVYPVWFLILFVLMVAKPWKYSFLSCGKKWKYSLAGFVFFVVSSLFASHGQGVALQAIVFWWIQVIFLFLFVFILAVKRVPREDILWWMVLAVLPHALLGMQQFSQQMVYGSKWLGMATQDPRQLGVSVVEVGEYRLLRSYGGFPHPNIFAAWLGLALVGLVSLAWRVREKWLAVFFSFFSFLLAAALITTFSRAAWIACGIGMALACYQGFRAKRFTASFVGMTLFAAMMGFVVIGSTQASFISSRFVADSRLEQKSLDERRQGLGQAVSLFFRRPFIGYGPNAELVPSAPSQASAPLQPAHSFLVLLFLDFGLVGASVFFYVVWRYRQMWFSGLPFIGWFFVSGFFDHFLWSFWSGQALTALVILFCLLPQIQMPEEG